MKGFRISLLSSMVVALSLFALPSERACAIEALAPLPDPPKVRPAQAKLGMYLFFDPRLSGDGAIRCASCHFPNKGWANNEANDEELSDAYPGSEYFRNAKSPVNVAFAETVYWDGRLPGKSMLQVHVRDHITETHFMNMDGRLMQERIKQIRLYVKMFKEAWNSEPSFGKIRNSIREYEKTLISRNVPFDKYLKGDKNALSGQAKRGLKLFKGKAGCVRCHNGRMLSDYKPYNLGVPENPKIWNDPFRHFTLRSFQLALGVPGFERAERDVGYYVVSKKEEDIGRFVTPSLREVSRTAPYMHNGTFKTLEEVIQFHAKGVGPDIEPVSLSKKEVSELVAFLKSLSGDEITAETPDDLPLDYPAIKDWYNARN
ncbi:MAG: cytochrome-c peroxidase [Candidatus Methylomirabilales bacterium]